MDYHESPEKRTAFIPHLKEGNFGRERLNSIFRLRFCRPCDNGRVRRASCPHLTHPRSWASAEVMDFGER
jgi:hypothetical protein